VSKVSVSQRFLVVSVTERVYDRCMFAGGIAQLDAAVDALASETFGADELRELLALRGRLEAVVTRAVGAFHVTGDCALDGAASTRSWLTWQASLSGGDAARLIRCGTALRSLPALSAAVDSGRVSVGQVDAIVTAVGDRIDAFASDEAAVVDIIDGLSVKDTGVVARRWAANHDAKLRRDHPDHIRPEPASRLSLSPLVDTWRIDGDLTDGDGQTLADTIRLFDPGRTEGLSPAQRRAAGLVAACAFALAHRDTDKPARHRPQVSIHITLDDDVATSDDGTVIAGPWVDTTLCDSDITRVIWSKTGEILDYGRKTKLISDGLRRAVIARDHHCRFPGCDRPASWTDVHHVKHWKHGGRTSIKNSALLCSFHHHLIHKPGWHLELDPDGTLHVTDPRGRKHTTRPPPRHTAAA
jgi:hypothetical protein